MTTGTVIVVARRTDNTIEQIEADVRFYHEDEPDQLAARFRTHIPDGAFLQVGWPVGRYRYVAEAKDYEMREGHFKLVPGTNSWTIYLRPRVAKEPDDA